MLEMVHAGLRARIQCGNACGDKRDAEAGCLFVSTRPFAAGVRMAGVASGQRQAEGGKLPKGPFEASSRRTHRPARGGGALFPAREARAAGGSIEHGTEALLCAGGTGRDYHRSRFQPLQPSFADLERPAARVALSGQGAAVRGADPLLGQEFATRMGGGAGLQRGAMADEKTRRVYRLERGGAPCASASAGG